MIFAGNTLRKESISQPLPFHLLPWVLLGIDFLGFLVTQGGATLALKGLIPQALDPLWLLVFFLNLAGLYLFNTYHPESEVAPLKLLGRTIVSGISVVLFCAILIGLVGAGSPNRLFWNRETRLFLGIILFTLWAALWRFGLAVQLRAISRKSRWIILGGRDNVKDVVSFFGDHYTHSEVMFLTNDADIRQDLLGSRFLVRQHLENLCNSEMPDCSGVLVDPHLEVSNTLIKELMQLRLEGTKVYSLPDFFEHFWLKVPPSALKDNWFTFASGFILLHNQLHLRVKRLFDIIIAGVMLGLLSPVMLFSAIAIKLDSPGPVFYSQIRTGLNQRPFRVLKFRSMYQDAEARGGAQWASQHDPRITRVGRLMRATRIDELPQLINVLVGNMSMMGPRPERPEFDQKLAEHIPYYNIRYLVRPGITGWAQVMYPYGASIEDAYEKFSYDLYYLKNYSLLLDLRIVLKTVRVVLFGKGR